MRPRVASAGLVCALLVVVVALLILGCGGSAERFSGARALPPDFELAQGTLASFAHPRTWTTARDSFRTVRILTARAPGEVGATTPNVELVEDPRVEDSFDRIVAARRAARSRTGEKRAEAREDVDVPGAERAVLYRGEVIFGGVRYDSFDLSILVDGGTGVFFSGAVPGDGDADAILDSLRLRDG